LNISILAPTRNRPAIVKRMVVSAFETASEPDKLECCFYIDDDDCVSEQALAGFTNIKIKCGKRIVLGDMWNKVFELASADIFMHGNDDVIFRTTGWDKAVMDAFAEYDDKIVFVYCNNGNPNQKSGTHGFLHRNWVDTIGYFTPPYFCSDCCDGWLNEVALALDRYVFLSDILIEHMHYTLGKSELDTTYKERIANGKRDNPHQLYLNKEPERLENVEKLREVMFENRIRGIR
jgi:hypothetical protein